MKRISHFFRFWMIILAINSSQHALAAEIRIGYAPNTFYAPILVAKHKQWLEEELAALDNGVHSVKWQSFSAGPMMNEAIAAGQLDVIFTGDLPAILGKSVGFDVSLIGISSSGYNSQAGVIAANSSITSVAELKGKKVATFKGSTAHHLLVLALKEVNLEPTDIELINLALPDMNNALQRGDVDAVFLWEPMLSKLELDRTVKVLRDGKGLKNAVAVIQAADSFIANNPAEAVAVLKAYQRGAELISQNPNQAAKLVAAELGQPVHIISLSLDKFTYSLDFTTEVVEALFNTEVFLAEQGMIRQKVDIDRFINRSLLHELKGQ